MDITALSLYKSFGAHPVLRDFSVTFHEGGTTCIMGPSGCGKTTLLRLILGLEKADCGNILGADVPKAAVFQENRLFEDFSPISNVAAVLPGKPDREWISSKLSVLGLHSHLTAPVRTLSGGMKRRVALARGMLAPASLVLLDEPFTSLDKETKQRAISFVKEHAQAKTLLLVTHDDSESAFFDAPTITLASISKSSL